MSLKKYIYILACEFYGDLDGDSICPAYKFKVSRDDNDPSRATISVYRPPCLVSIQVSSVQG